MAGQCVAVRTAELHSGYLPTDGAGEPSSVDRTPGACRGVAIQSDPVEAVELRDWSAGVEVL